MRFERKDFVVILFHCNKEFRVLDLEISQFDMCSFSQVGIHCTAHERSPK